MTPEYIEVVEITARARAGSHISECVREAILLSMEESRNVKLIHNGTAYVISPVSILKHIYDEHRTDQS